MAMLAVVAAIGAATLAGTTPIEAASAPIRFDRSVPAVPRLELVVTVDEVTTAGARGTVTCNRSADAFLEALVEQRKDRSQASGFGSADQPIACEVTPTGWQVRFTSRDGALRSGDATYHVFATAYDGFESTEVQQSGEVRISGDGRPSPSTGPARP